MACSDSGEQTNAQTNAVNSAEKKDSSVTTQKKDSSDDIAVDYITMKNADDNTVKSFKSADKKVDSQSPFANPSKTRTAYVAQFKMESDTDATLDVIVV